jgi:hypothetical protein
MELPFDTVTGHSGSNAASESVFADELSKSPRLCRFGGLETVRCCALDVCSIEESLEHSDWRVSIELDLKHSTSVLECNYRQT